MELFDSPKFEASPRRQPPVAVRSQPIPPSGLEILNFGSGGENPLKKMLDSKWLIPICTIVAVVIFLIGAWLYTNYFDKSGPPGSPFAAATGDILTTGGTGGKSKRVKSLSHNRRRRSDATESAKRRTYIISEYDKTTPFSATP